MERVIVITDTTTNSIYAIATEKGGSVRIFGSNPVANQWAEWADAKLQGRGKLEDVDKFLDNSFAVEGPKPITRQLRAQIADSMAKFSESARSEISNESEKAPEEKSALLSVIHEIASAPNPDAPLHHAKDAASKRALINYKGLAFLNDRSLATMGYDIKKTRAVFDPNLAGGNGGWRCPVGTRYGGQITDRYGRGCGWGAVRRLANALTDTGERLERGLDGRRKRRVAKRNRRMARRLANAPQSPRSRMGTVRALSRGADALTPDSGPRRRRTSIPGRAERLADRVDGGFGRRPRAERRAGRSGMRASRPSGRTGRTDIPGRLDRAAEDVLRGNFLENRRRRRRERRGSARNREGIPERMDRAAQEILDGNFLENRRRRRREAVRQQAIDKPRTTVSGRVGRTESVPRRPNRTVRETVPERPRRTARETVPERPSRRIGAEDMPDSAVPRRPATRPRPATPRPGNPPEASKPQDEISIPMAERKLDRRRIQLQDLGRTPEERKRIRDAVARGIERDRQREVAKREKAIREADVDALQQQVRGLEIAYSDQIAVADDRNKPVGVRYAAHEKARMLQDEKMKTQEAFASVRRQPPPKDAPSESAPKPKKREGILGSLRGRWSSRKKNEKRGSIADADGTGRKITNPRIQTKDDAVAFVRDGGSLSEVPNEFWLDAVQANSSQDDIDTSTRYRMLAANGGAIGDTRIFVVRDADGKSTDQGWVFKADNNDDIETTAAEIGSQYLMVREGLPVEFAGWDGKNGSGSTYAVLPFAQNGLPDGAVDGARNGGNFDRNLYQGLDDKALPQRLSNFLHNYMLAVADRHEGNGMTYMVDGVPFIVPIDQGWAGRGHALDRLPSLASYAGGFWMDFDLPGEITAHIGGRVNPDEAKQQAKAIVDTYDEMLERAEAVLAEGKAEFIRKMLQGISPDKERAGQRGLGRVFDIYEKQVKRLRADRTTNLQLLFPNNFDIPGL